jgi:hypothetical protein
LNEIYIYIYIIFYIKTNEALDYVCGMSVTMVL